MTPVPLLVTGLHGESKALLHLFLAAILSNALHKTFLIRLRAETLGGGGGTFADFGLVLNARPRASRGIVQ